MYIVLVLKDLIVFILHISINIGQWIVSVVKTTIWTMFIICLKILEVLEIISTDFAIFLQDFGERLYRACELLNQGIFAVILEISEMIESTMSFAFNIITNLSAASQAIQNLFTGTIQGIGSLFMFGKACLILLGRSIWLVITFIPSTLLYLTSSTITFIQNLQERTLKYLKHQCQMISNLSRDFYDFIIDVPLESMMGLLTVICLIYFFTQFYVALTAYFREKAQSLINIVNYKYRSWRSAYNRRFNKRRTHPTLPAVIQYDNASKFESSEQFCVICHERSKCILLLPCRHLCLCSECTSTLRLYGHTCPICRVHVERSMRVFT